MVACTKRPRVNPHGNGNLPCRDMSHVYGRISFWRWAFPCVYHKARNTYTGDLCGLAFQKPIHSLIEVPNPNIWSTPSQDLDPAAFAFPHQQHLGKPGLFTGILFRRCLLKSRRKRDIKLKPSRPKLPTQKCFYFRKEHTSKMRPGGLLPTCIASNPSNTHGESEAWSLSESGGKTARHDDC